MAFFSKHKPDKNLEIERMINDHGDAVLKTAVMYLQDIHRAEDVFQEVFIKIFKGYDSFRRESSEKTWIIRITINTCRDFLKGLWNREVFPEDGMTFVPEENDPENMAIENMENRELFQRVVNLPTAYKEVILLYYYHGFNTVEISKILSISEGTVRSKLVRGRELLRKNMEKENGQDE